MTMVEKDFPSKFDSEHEELLARAYNEARRPYRETVSPIPEEAFEKSSGNSSWRYFLEINSACNLKCSMCIQGDLNGFSHQNGVMPQTLFEQVVDKIANENSQSDICLYGNSEPFVHPRLAECIAYIRSKDINCLVSTNFHIIKRLKSVLEAKPTILIISLSGFNQETYQKAHREGDIEKVKENMRELAQLKKDLNSDVPVLVHYHLYKDNWGNEYDLMKAFAEDLGFSITPTWARSISMEKTIQYLRHKEREENGYVPKLEVSKAAWGEQKDWTKILPEVTEDFLNEIERLGITPDEMSKEYSQYTTPDVCPVGDLFTYIRYDGSVSLCSCFADRRLSIAPSFLEISQQEIRRRRRWQSICKECLRYKMYMYFHILDTPKWEDIMEKKIPGLPADRRKF